MSMRIAGNDPAELLRLGATIGGGSGEGEDDTSTDDSTPESGAAAPAAAAPEPAADTTPAPAPEPAAAPVTTDEWEDIRDYARTQGLDLSQLPDSQRAAEYLVNLARQNNSYLQYGQQLAPYYSEFQEFLRSRNQGARAGAAPAAAPAPSTPKGFGLPEYDPAWLDWLERDAAGNVVPKVGAPPDIVSKVVQYQQALRKFQDSFWQKPHEALNPLIQEAVTPLVQQAIQQNLQQYQDQIYSTNLLAQHTNWMHYHDAQGQIIRDPVSGAYAMTPEGQLYITHLRRAGQMGISGLSNQHNYAMDQLRLAYYAQQVNQQQAVSGAAQRDQQLLQQRNRRAPNSGGSLNGGPAVSQNQSASLSDRLRMALQGGGVTDAQLVNGEA